MPAAIAYGGAWYAYVDAEDAGVALDPDNAAGIIAAGRELKAIAAQAVDIVHPAGGGELDQLFVRKHL